MIHKLLGLHLPLPARDRSEKHRVATVLELFYDLVIVIAIASTAEALHHSVVERHIVSGLLSYAMVFWAIWWAWMSFTWFASSYDTDDVYYRVAVFIQLLGSLIVAAAVGSAFRNWNFTVVVTGYVIMRVAQVALWIRVRKGNPKDAVGALRYAVGIILCQIGWVVLVLFLPTSMMLVGFLFLALCEHFVPFFAHLRAQTNWHRHHIIERYGLLMIIVLGESMLALVRGIQEVIRHYDPTLLGVLGGGFLILLAMWWLYFAEDEHPTLVYSKKGFIWGYGHYFIFASAAATGAGLAIAADYATGHAHIAHLVANASVAIPVALYLCALWIVHDLLARRRYWIKLILPAAALLVLALSFLEFGVALMGTVMVIALVCKIRAKHSLQHAE